MPVKNMIENKSKYSKEAGKEQAASQPRPRL